MKRQALLKLGILVSLLGAVPAFAQTYTEDQPLRDGSKGPAMICKRNSAAAALTDTDGDGSFVSCDNTGAINVNATVSLPSGAATEAKQDTQITGIAALSSAEDSAASDTQALVRTGCVAVTSSSPSARTSAAEEWSQQVCNSFGATLVDINRAYQKSAGDGLLKSEDVAAGDGDALAAIGGVRQTTLASRTNTDNDRTDLKMDDLDRVYVNPWGINPGAFFTAVLTSDIADTTSTEIKAAGGGSIRHYITAITVSNTDLTVVSLVQVLCAATVVWSGPAAALGGGYSVSLPTPIRCGANEAVNIKPVTTSAEIRASITGFSIAG